MTVLMHDGTAVISRYGAVQPLPTIIHEPDNGRPCTHLTKPMPDVIALRRGPVDRLNFQPRFAADPLRRERAGRSSHVPFTVRPGVIAARRGDLLILSVELIGPVSMRHPARGTRTSKNMQMVDQRVQHHWYFRLHNVDDDPAILIGVKEP